MFFSLGFSNNKNNHSTVFSILDLVASLSALI